MCSQMSDSALLFIWCTVSKRHREAVAEWTRAWALEPVAEWTWLKVTRSGEPVVAMDKIHKQPFEFLYVARTRGFKLPGTCPPEVHGKKSVKGCVMKTATHATFDHAFLPAETIQISDLKKS